jgi:hypothetical protein
MTEAEWLAGTDLSQLLRQLGRKARTRKLRLFAVACCRRAWERIPHEACRQAVEVAERFADHQASNQEREQATRAVRGLCRLGGSASASYSVAYHVVRGTRYTFVNARIAAAFAVFTVPGVRQLGDGYAEGAAQCRLLRDIFGNPFRPVFVDPTWLAWSGGTVRKLAQAIYDERAFERLPVLSDALEEAGCTNADLLGHCRQPGEHVRGCWAVDLLLGKS